jgi:hypothetical protein
MITEKNIKNEFGGFINLVKDQNIIVSLDYLWSIYKDFEKNPL